MNENRATCPVTVDSQENIPVNDWLQQWSEGLPREVSSLSASEFFDMVGGEQGTATISNLERVWALYDSQEKKDCENDYNNKNLPYLKPGTIVYLPIDKVMYELSKLSKQGQFLSQGDFKSYWSENYEKIVSSINYKPWDSETNADALVDSKVVPQTLRVWVYVKALDKIIDLSAFVISMNTIKSALNGNFTLTLAPTMSQDAAIGFGNGYYEHFVTTNKDGIFNRSFLEKYLTQNDVVFIRFEKLLIEEDSLTGEEDSLEISPSKLVNSDNNYNVWDMIGLIDMVNVSVDSRSDDMNITIVGRDFTKMFVEDGSYFIPLKWIEGNKDLWFYIGSENDSWFKRNIVSGSYDFMFNYGFRGIRETVWFIINLLSNIGIVPDNLFAAYNDRRTTSYKLEVADQESQDVNGLWQIVKVFVDDNLENRTIVDPSFANPDGTIMSFLQKTCQAPFVEMLFDTYVDTLDIVIRQPPFTEAAIKDVVDSETFIEIEPGNFISSSLQYDDRVYSSYRLFPQDYLIGNDRTVGLAFVPIIYLEEMTKYFGNKKMEVQDMYVAANSLIGANGTDNINSMAAAMLNDLLFVVETTAYLPFTRKGTITINGDRRIKVGTFVKNDVTDELFYVTNVVQSIVFSESSIERTTTLTVERGMNFSILKGVSTDTIETSTGSETASYFKIVRLDDIRNDIRTAQQAAKSGQTKTSGLGNTPIDQAQFEYFLKRRMFK